MFDECLLFVAGEGVPHIDVMGGHLLVPVDDHAFRAMCEVAGYEYIPSDDPRYGDCLRKAAAAICDYERQPVTEEEPQPEE